MDGRLILDKVRNHLSHLRAIWLRWDAVTRCGVCLTVAMFMVVSVAAIFPRGSGELDDLGTWQAPIDAAAARRAIVVDYDGATGRLNLHDDPTQFASVVRDQRLKRFVRAHMDKFNRAVQGRSFRSEGLVQGARDGLFSVQLRRDRDQLLQPTLWVRDLSAHNIYPVRVERTKSLGSIYLRPDDGPKPFFSDGELGIFLEPTATMEVPVEEVNSASPAKLQRIPLARGGYYNAQQATLVDGRDRARAVVTAAADGRSVHVKGVDEFAVFVDNNPPLGGGDVHVPEGSVVEVAGRFFEVRVEDSAVAAKSRRRGDQISRVYPMGRLFHIVGPLSLTGQHQPLGMEYMFQEYLMGMAEKGIPQGQLWLTLDRRMQAALTTAVRDLAGYSRYKTASALVLNARTGAILAMSGEPNRYDPEDTRAILDILNKGTEPFYNHGCFRRHVIGSVTKPFFAFAGLQIMGPQVAEMSIDISGSETSTLYGHRLYGNRDRQFEIKQNQVSFERYLIRSDNSFQHSLGLLLMAGVTDPLQELSAPWLVQREGKPVLRPNAGGKGDTLQVGSLGELENRLVMDGVHPLAITMQNIYGLRTTSGEGRVDDRDIGIYGERLLALSEEIIRMRNPGVTDARAILARRSVVCAPEMPRMELQDVRNTMDASNVLFGANRNRWTDVKLAESFSRILTGRRVKARLVHTYLDTLTGAKVDLEAAALDTPTMNLPNPDATDTIKRVLARVPLRAGGRFPEGTANLLHDTVSAMKRDIPGFGFYGKTGTIDDGKMDDPDSRLFMCTFGLEENGELSTAAFTLVVYLKTATDEDAVLKMIRDHLAEWYPLLLETVHEPSTDKTVAEGAP